MPKAIFLFPNFYILPAKLGNFLFSSVFSKKFKFSFKLSILQKSFSILLFSYWFFWKRNFQKLFFKLFFVHFSMG